MQIRVYPKDDLGLPGVIERDGSFGGGDSAAIWGTVATLAPTDEWLKNDHYYIRDEQPVRHPIIALGGHLNRFSRDQMISILTAGIINGSLFVTDELIRLHKQKFFLRAWNTVRNGDLKPQIADVTLFQVWALELRYEFRDSLLTYIPRAVCDLENLFGTIIILAGGDKTRVRRNHMLVAYTCYKKYPTFISKLTYKLCPFKQMIEDWDAHCIAVKEYSTAELFEQKILNK